MEVVSRGVKKKDYIIMMTEKRKLIIICSSAFVVSIAVIVFGILSAKRNRQPVEKKIAIKTIKKTVRVVKPLPIKKTVRVVKPLADNYMFYASDLQYEHSGMIADIRVALLWQYDENDYIELENNLKKTDWYFSNLIIYLDDNGVFRGVEKREAYEMFSGFIQMTTNAYKGILENMNTSNKQLAINTLTGINNEEYSKWQDIYEIFEKRFE